MKFNHLFIAYAAVISLACISLLSCTGDTCKDLSKKMGLDKKHEKVENLNLNVYIENSGSIDGYINGMSLFKSDIYALISNSAIDTVSLNYINKNIIPQKGVSCRDFVMDLTPKSFKALGGDRSSSDIAAAVEKAIANANSTPILLASDFIFSPDPAHRQNVTEYFNIQRADIKNSIEKLLKAKGTELAVVILKGESLFNGTYWNVDEMPTPYNGKRPYYVLLAGRKEKVALLLSKTRNATHFNNTYSELLPSTVYYEILKSHNDKVGNFQACKSSKIHIKKIQSTHRDNKFEIRIGVDFSTLPLQNSYILDANKYSINTKAYKIKCIEEVNDKNSSFTHIITLQSTGKLVAANIDITLNKEFPAWIAESDDPTGASPLPNKTFGIKPLLEGIKQAYDSKSDKNYYTNIKLILEK